jgi:hypothetical protein
MEYFYVFLLAIPIIALISSGRRGTPMMFKVPPKEFEEIANGSNNLIIRHRMLPGLTITYIIRDGDYYFYTRVAKSITLPDTSKIRDVKGFPW